MQKNIKIEFSRIIDFDEIGINSAHFEVEASEEELVLLAARFQLPGISHLSAQFFLKQADETGCYQIEGSVKGEVIQACVATLEEVPESINARFKVLLRPSSAETPEQEFDINLENEVDTEFYSAPSVDLGEIASQYLCLHLNPFPRSPNAPVPIPEAEKKDRLNPFVEALKGIKDNTEPS